MPKIHMLRSELPLQSGADYQADCGAPVSSAQFPFIFDTDYEKSATLNTLLVCKKCYAVRGEGRYLYGLVNGQEAMTRERSVISQITRAQAVICYQQLRSERCGVCGGKKDSYYSFCRGCYFALPEEFRPGLWIKRTDPQSVLEFCERYFIAKQWLRRMRRSEVA